MHLVQQRADGDCGVAALAMVAELSYEDVYVVLAKTDKHFRGKAGLHNRDIVLAAKQLGLDLQPTRRYDLDVDDGVLRVRFTRADSKNEGGHFVAVNNGLVICPTHLEVLPWRDYMERAKARPCTLLKAS